MRVAPSTLTPPCQLSSRSPERLFFWELRPSGKDKNGRRSVLTDACGTVDHALALERGKTYSAYLRRPAPVLNFGATSTATGAPMDATSNLNLPIIAAAQAQKHVT